MSMAGQAAASEVTGISTASARASTGATIGARPAVLRAAPPTQSRGPVATVGSGRAVFDALTEALRAGLARQA